MKRSAFPLVRGVLGPRVEMAQPEACAALGEASRVVSGAVVGHHARDRHPKLADVGDGRLEEGGDTGAGLGIDLGEAEAGVVVDGDAHGVPAGPGRSPAGGFR